MSEDVAAQNAEAAASTLSPAEAEQAGQSITPPQSEAPKEPSTKIERAGLEGVHWLSHLSEEMIVEFHWITHEEVRKILNWIAGKTDKKKVQCRDFTPSQVAFLTNLIEENIMSKLTDAMAEVGKAIADTKAAVDPAHIAAIDAAITALQEHDSSEDAEVSDAIAGLQALHDAVIPATGDTGATS